MRLYIDGAVVSSLAISKTIATSSEPLRMGHWATEWFAGILDEVRLYPRALTAAEIGGLVSKASAHAPSPPPLVTGMISPWTDGGRISGGTERLTVRVMLPRRLAGGCSPVASIQGRLHTSSFSNRS